MKYSAPAAQGGQQRLNLNLGGIDNSTAQKKLKGFNHLNTLQDIAIKWVDRGYYGTSSRALDALIRGVL